MKPDIEQLLNAAGTKNLYQYRWLALICIYELSIQMMLVSFPYFEEMPLVEYFYKSHPEEKHQSQLTYAMCHDEKIIYKIIAHKQYSWGYEFGFYCDALKTGLLSSAIFTGHIFGALISQFMCNIAGRKPTMVVAGMLFSGLAVTISLCKSYTSILIFSIMIQMTSVVSVTAFQCMSFEIMAIDLRAFTVGITWAFYSLCGIQYSLLLHFYGNWRIIFLGSGCLCVTTTFCIIMLTTESPRLLLMKGQYYAMFKCLKFIAAVNGREKELQEYCSLNQLEAEFYEETQQAAVEDGEREKLIPKQATVRKPNDLMLLWKLFKYKSLRVLLLLNLVAIWGVEAVYYRISIDLKRMPGEIYLVGVAYFIVEFFGYMIASMLANTRLGRLSCCIIFLSVTLVGNTCNYFLIDYMPVNVFYGICIANKFSTAGVFCVIVIYELEVFPTPVRSHAYGLMLIFGKFSSIVTSLIVELMNDFDMFITFSVFNAAAILALLFMEETRGKPLKNEILEESEPQEKGIIKLSNN